jgi:hypothetical protein
MAVTNEQVLVAISEYRAENSRPCPAKYLVEKFGDEALDIIAGLKKDGTLVGKRGRTGGLVPAGDATASVSSEETTTDSGDSVENQFAELVAKLAAAESPNEVAVG